MVSCKNVTSFDLKQISIRQKQPYDVVFHPVSIVNDDAIDCLVLYFFALLEISHFCLIFFTITSHNFCSVLASI